MPPVRFAKGRCPKRETKSLNISASISFGISQSFQQTRRLCASCNCHRNRPPQWPTGRPADRHRNCSTLRAAFATPDGLVHRCRPYQCKERLLPQPSCVPECPEQLTDLSFLTDRLRSAPGNTEQSPVASIQHNSPDLRVSECLGALSLQTKRSRKTRLLRDHIADPSSLIQETPQLPRP